MKIAKLPHVLLVFVLATVFVVALALAACSSPQASRATKVVHVDAASIVDDSSSAASTVSTESASSSAASASASSTSASSSATSASSASSSAAAQKASKAAAEKLYDKLGIEDMTDEYRDLFEHGKKGAKYQKYIVLHDTEGDGDPAGVVHSWGSTANGVAAHFVVGKDGTVVQCVDIDQIAHHAGFGDNGHNELYGVEDESRDDRVGTEPIGDWASDYGMNSYSIGIEMVHVGGEGDYPEEQLEAVDDLIAYIDAYYDKESEIIDHKAWRTGNSDTSEEFAEYFANYQDHRTHEQEA